MKWYIKVLKNYANFRGRARRKEYWMFVLFNIIIVFLLNTLLFLLYGPFWFENTTGLIIILLYLIAILLPSLAVTVRRLHDTNRSGWWILISLIPFIGSIWLFILLVSEGTPYENKYGPSPYELASSQS